MKVEELKELGIDEKQLKILFALKNGPKSGPEIEKETGLRQPEVSRALLQLEKCGYVKFEKAEKKFKHGAPRKIWSLTKSFEEIIKGIVNKKLAELDRKLRIAVEVSFELGDAIDEKTVKDLQKFI